MKRWMDGYGNVNVTVHVNVNVNVTVVHIHTHPLVHLSCLAYLSVFTTGKFEEYNVATYDPRKALLANVKSK